MVALNALYNFIVTLEKRAEKKDKSTADRNATVSKYVSLHVLLWIHYKIDSIMSKVAVESFESVTTQ